MVTITLLAAAVAMPVAGRLADLFGKQRVLLVSAGILLVGSVVCAMSDSLAPMLVGRALQGLAMGFIPVGISLMREITPPRLTGTAIAVDERDPRRRRRHRPAALGVDRRRTSWHALFWLSAVLAA